ncbi:MAG: hypothetical protein BWY72_02279 [Bacteroidetes bacterium ADurb.Bin416]|nr:MAG: hypothetical protein BWY72_02279 [Bacteroidetes bacterium ADurb.Bin416]
MVAQVFGELVHEGVEVAVLAIELIEAEKAVEGLDEFVKRRLTQWLLLVEEARGKDGWVCWLSFSSLGGVQGYPCPGTDQVVEGLFPSTDFVVVIEGELGQQEGVVGFGQDPEGRDEELQGCGGR